MYKYHTDDEIIEALKEYAKEAEDCDKLLTYWLNNAVERLDQKDKQMDYLRHRGEVAANIIGNQLINEALYEEG